MTPNNLENAFSLNHNSNNLLNSTMNSMSLREKYNKQRLDRHTFSESNIELHNDVYKITLDEVKIYFNNFFCQNY